MPIEEIYQQNTPIKSNNEVLPAIEESKARQDFDSIVPLSQNNEEDEFDEGVNPLANKDIDLEKVDEGLKNYTAQIFFFLGITYRSLNMFNEAI